MKCPMSFPNPDERGAWADCNESCAWLIQKTDGTVAVCAVAVDAVKGVGALEVKNGIRIGDSHD